MEWIAKTLPAGAVVGMDPFLHGATGMAKMRDTLVPRGIAVHPLPTNPIDALWTADNGRPAPPSGPLRVHPLAHAGKSVADKLADVRAALAKVRVALPCGPRLPGGTQARCLNAHCPPRQADAKALVSASLDEVAWLLNVRGCDVPCNPVSVAYAVVTADGAWLFVDPDKVPISSRSLDKA